MTVLAERPRLDDLAALLHRATRGDTDAFMRFYDATRDHVFRLALARARIGGRDEDAARQVAEDDALLRYVAAWRQSAFQPASGLSPLAWLLTLDPAAEHAIEESACA